MALALIKCGWETKRDKMQTKQMGHVRAHERKRISRYALWAASSLCVLAVLPFVARADAAPKVVTVEYRFFPGLAQMTGNWAALKAASDGKVYVGLACNGCDGHLVFYDSKKDRMVDVGDLNTIDR